jgi:hypothetical protein
MWPGGTGQNWPPICGETPRRSLACGSNETAEARGSGEGVPESSGRTFWERALDIFPEDEEDEEGEEDEDEQASPKEASANDAAITPDAGAVLPEPFDPSTSLTFGPTLPPHIDRILSGRLVLLGVSDSGKSNNVAVIVEEIGRFGLPLFYLDTEDEARGLCDRRFLPAPFWVDRATLAPEQAYDFAHKMLSARPPMQAIINLQSYSISEAALLIYWLIRGIRSWKRPCRYGSLVKSSWMRRRSGCRRMPPAPPQPDARAGPRKQTRRAREAPPRLALRPVRARLF